MKFLKSVVLEISKDCYLYYCIVEAKSDFKLYFRGIKCIRNK